MLVALALVQVLEPKIPALASHARANPWIVLKFAICYLLIGYTGGVDSHLLAGAAAAGGLGGDRLRHPRHAACSRCSPALTYLSFLLVRRLDAVRDRRAATLIGRIVFLVMVGQPGEHAGGGSAHPIATIAGAPPSSSPRPTASCRRRKRPCAAPTGWPRWASSPPGWRTSCAIRWARSGRRRRCCNQQSQRGKRSRARGRGLHLHRGGPHQFADHALPAIRAPAGDSAGARRSRADARPRHRAGGARGARRSRSTRTTRPRFRRSPSMRS